MFFTSFMLWLNFLCRLFLSQDKEMKGVRSKGNVKSSRGEEGEAQSLAKFRSDALRCSSMHVRNRLRKALLVLLERSLPFLHPMLATQRSNRTTWHDIYLWHLYDISMTYWLHIASIHFSLELIRNIHSSGGAVQRGLIYPLEQLLGMAPSVAGDGVTGHAEIQRYYDLWYFVVIQLHGMRSPGLYNFASPGGEWSQLWPILFGARRFAGHLRAFPYPPRPLESVSRGLVTRRIRRTLVRGCQGQAYTASATSPLSEQAFCPPEVSNFVPIFMHFFERIFSYCHFASYCRITHLVNSISLTIQVFHVFCRLRLPF